MSFLASHKANQNKKLRVVQSQREATGSSLVTGSEKHALYKRKFNRFTYLIFRASDRCQHDALDA